MACSSCVSTRGLKFQLDIYLTLYLFHRDNPREADEEHLSLNYGRTGLGETPKALLILTNKTAIATKFDVAVEHFCAARTPTPPTGKLTYF